MSAGMQAVCLNLSPGGASGIYCCLPLCACVSPGVECCVLWLPNIKIFGGRLVGSEKLKIPSLI